MKRKVVLSVCLAVSMLSALTMYGQTCPPEDPINCTPWVVGSNSPKRVDMGLPDCQAFVTYRTRVCAGVTEFYIDNIQYTGTCEAMEKFSIYQYSYNAALEYITLGFVEGEVPLSSMPPCSSGARPQRSYVYTASCGIWVGCEYEIDESVAPNCDNGYIPPYPDYGAIGNKKVKVYKWQSCGTTCCKRTFEFCQETRLVGGGPLRKATQISKVRLAPCSDEANYAPQPCQDGC
jgi:hypothetical protein